MSAAGEIVFSTPPPKPSAARPVTWREVFAVVALVAVSDVTIYRGEGFGGIGLLFAVAPLLFLFGAPVPRRNVSTWIILMLLWVVALRVVWMGTVPAIAAGFAVLVALAMCLAGITPFIPEWLAFSSLLFLSGVGALGEHLTFWTQRRPAIRQANWINVLLPLTVCLMFSALFLMANPDLVAAFGEQVSRMVRNIRTWLFDFMPSWSELLFLAIAGYLIVGLIRPIELPRTGDEEVGDPFRPLSQPSPLYPALRNTLLMVSILFAAYLTFEFQSLWFRVFPKGFYYAGYAHEGAAWLTAALALATIILSLIFRGAVRQDPRLPTLRRLAWVWSALNLVLAIAVYHRLFIYVGFNGMTRMRIIGLFGISTVVVGFALVIVKIAWDKRFSWLVRRQLSALALACYLLAVLPLDSLVVTYNVHQVMRGNLAPSVQVSVQPLSSEGMVYLLPLLQCPDQKIREGVRALLAEFDQQAQTRATRRATLNWTAYQGSEERLLRVLAQSRSQWSAYRDPEVRHPVVEEFRNYVYQWY